MVTTNAGNGYSNEGRPKYNKGGEKRERKAFTNENGNTDRPRGDFKRNSNGESKGNGEYRQRLNSGEYRGRGNSQGNGNGEYRGRSNGQGGSNGEYKPRNNNGGYNSSRSYGNGGYSNNGYNNRGFDKDKDEETPVIRRKPKADSKPKEQQSDKMEIISRIEKEKKAMKKKHNDSKSDSRPVKHTVKPKRSGNIDWTREYENDSYDDDDLDMYL